MMQAPTFTRDPPALTRDPKPFLSDEPGYEYGSVLPFRKNTATGELGLAVPEMLRAPIRGLQINPMRFDVSDPQQRSDLGSAAAMFGGFSPAPGRVPFAAPRSSFPLAEIGRKVEAAPIEAPPAQAAPPVAVPQPPALVRDEPPAVAAAPVAPTPIAAPAPVIDAPAQVVAPVARAPVPRAANPFETVPKEPKRLIQFLRESTKNGSDIHATVTPGGLRDVGGDVAGIIGGPKGRPGLINNASGRNLDDATLHAWQDGYFPQHDQRPEINHLLDAIRDDHNGTPVYSIHNQDEVAAYRGAVDRNQEIDQLAAQHGIPTRGLTRPQFFDHLADHLSVDDMATEHAAQADAHDAAYHDAELMAKEWASENSSNIDGIHAMNSQDRTLEDMEHEYRQDNALAPAQQGQGGSGEHGSPESYSAGFPDGAPQSGRGAANSGRDGTQGQQAPSQIMPTPPVPLVRDR